MSRDEQKLDEITTLWVSAQPAIAAYLSSMVNNFADAEDLLQTTATLVIRKRDQFESGTSFIAWTMAIARFEVLRYYRDQAKFPAGLDEEVINLLSDSYVKHESELESVQFALRQCIKKLPGKMMNIINLRYYQDLKPAKIAEQLGMAPNTISVTLMRIRQNLKLCIQSVLSNEAK